MNKRSLDLDIESIVSLFITVSLVIIIFNINIFNEAIGFMPILSSIKKGSEILRSSPIVLSQLIISMVAQKLLNKLTTSTNYMNKFIKTMIINSISVSISSCIIYGIIKLIQEHFNIKLSIIGICISVIIIGMLFLFSFYNKFAREIVIEILISIGTYLITIKLIPDIDSFAQTILYIFAILFILLLGIYFLTKSL